MIVFLFLLVVGAPQGKPLTGPALDQKTQEVASLLRCPVCQGMSVADSPSTVALDMKREVREMLARGYTQQQVLDSFEQSYGQFVLQKPKSPVVWILPVILLLVGVVVVVITARKLSGKPATDNREPATDAYVERVRQLVEKE